MGLRMIQILSLLKAKGGYVLNDWLSIFVCIQIRRRLVGALVF